MGKKITNTLVLGIGNILLSDEGIGVRVIEYLQKCPLPDHVDLVDGGTAGADLIDVLSDRHTVIIVDAADADAPPGTIVRLTPQDWLNEYRPALSLHDLDIPQTLAMTHLLGCAPRNVICRLCPAVPAPLATKPRAARPAGRERRMGSSSPRRLS